MNRRKHPRRKFGRQHLAAFARDSKRRTENRLRCRRTHSYNQLWLDQPQLRFHPRAAGCDLARVWFLMNPAFPARLPLKMFHCVRDINLRSINSGFFERLIHDFPSWPYKWLTGDVFVIARLLANQHDRCALGTFAKHSLRGALVKVTRFAILRRVAHCRPTCRVWWLRRAGKLLVVCWHLPIKNRKSSTL